MLAVGLTSLIAAVILISASVIWKGALRVTFHLSEATAKILSALEIVVVSVSGLGVVLLTFALIRISGSVELTNRTANFCHPIIYYSSYTLLFLLYTLLSLIMLVLCLIFHQYQKTQ